MAMDGVELAARFSGAPNRLRLCGPKEFNPSCRSSLEAQLRKFRAPYAYLQLIASAAGLKPFDYGVAEAFWIGNKLLETVERRDLAKTILTHFAGPGRLSPARARRLANHLPDRVFPNHSFHVFYVGSISGVLRGTARELDACRISWGRVMGADEKGYAVRCRPVLLKGRRAAARSACSGPGIGRRACLGPPIFRRWLAWDGLPPPAVGSVIAAHWGQAILPLTARQRTNLEKYTQINLRQHAARPR